MREIEGELQLKNTSNYLKNLGHKYYSNNKKELPSVQQMSIEQATSNLKKGRTSDKKKKDSVFKSLSQKNDEYDMKKELSEMSQMIQNNEQVRKMVYDSARKY